MKNILPLVVILAVMYGIYILLQKDSYVGFFYPNASDLTLDVMSDSKFETVSECRAWAESMALEYGRDIVENDYRYDYECGLNCDLSGNKPYVCESTTK